MQRKHQQGVRRPVLPAYLCMEACIALLHAAVGVLCDGTRAEGCSGCCFGRQWHKGGTNGVLSLELIQGLAQDDRVC